MNPVAIFYHGLFFKGSEPLPVAFNVVAEQMALLQACGLLPHVKFMLAGINGGAESEPLAKLLFPGGTKIVLHGLDSFNENLTLIEIEKWVKHHSHWNVLYLHSKGATHKADDPMRTNWRNCLMRHCVANWKRCLADLEAGYDSVGAHWMTHQQNPSIVPKGQYIWAGNFWWAKSDFLATLPSIMLRDRIKLSGIKSVESRFESEVWIGNGPRLPRVKDYAANHYFTKCPP